MLYHPVKIGKLEIPGNVFLAPVAGYSDRSFRSICREQGAAFTYTEMVSAEALVRGNWKTTELMARAANETAYAVQIFGGEPEIMKQAALIVLENTGCECIDINCGCPVPKIVKTGAGSALTRDPERLGKVVGAVSEVVKEFEEKNGKSTEVTVKIRSGWDSKSITFKEAALAALENGAKALTMHPRTKAQGYEGFSDWEKLKELVELVQKYTGDAGSASAGTSDTDDSASTSGADGAAGTGTVASSAGGSENSGNGASCIHKIPVFGSGDLFKPEDARKMLVTTGCDGVMFARGAMGNPFIFTKTIQLLQTGRYDEIPAGMRLKTAFKELEMLARDTNEQHACLEMRKRFSAYSKGIEGGAELRAQTVHASTLADYHRIYDPYL